MNVHAKEKGYSNGHIEKDAHHQCKADAGLKQEFVHPQPAILPALTTVCIAVLGATGKSQAPQEQPGHLRCLHRMVMEVDIRSIWAIGHGVFFRWFLASGLIVKPVVILGFRRFPWSKSLLVGVAMIGFSAPLIAFCPVGLIIAGLLTEGLLRSGLGVDHLGAFGWVSPIVGIARSSVEK